MTGGLQCLPCNVGMLFLYQYIVRIKRRNRKDRNAVLRQRIDKGG